jgi:pimeloyl-ACP methyl ester carboxylesterase
MSNTEARVGSATRGATRLVFDGIGGITQIVEGMHANIGAGSPPLGRGTNGRTGGISRLVYEGIQRTNNGTGWLVDHVLGQLERMPTLSRTLANPQSDTLLGALNGILGDHLVERENPLAIPMQLREHTRTAPAAKSAAAGAGKKDAASADQTDEAKGRKILVLVHGLCMHDYQWNREGHDHGEALAADLDYEPFYVHYNTGLHISENGRGLASLLEDFVSKSQAPVEEISILGHSMGGLVARSACEAAASAGHSWPRRLRKIVFLGTPHHGAPLERIGNSVLSAAKLSPYVAPLTRLAVFRSAGISDLRHGSLVDQDWQSRNTDFDRRDLRRTVPLPEGVDCYAIATTLAKKDGSSRGAFLGDGLVPTDSALGRHTDPSRSLEFAAEHQWTGVGINHLDLLCRPEVYSAIRNWLAE